jgi:hypothetical protein
MKKLPEYVFTLKAKDRPDIKSFGPNLLIFTNFVTNWNRSKPPAIAPAVVQNVKTGEVPLVYEYRKRYLLFKVSETINS